MKLSTTFIGLIGLFATTTLCAPTDDEAECGALGVMDWSQEDLPEGTDTSKLRKCKEHPVSLLSDGPDTNPLEARENLSCERMRAQFGCSEGWCWALCNGLTDWCWLAYEAGKGGWTPCGRDYDCEWSFLNKNAKCGKGKNCKSCGCSCTRHGPK